MCKIKKLDRSSFLKSVAIAGTGVLSPDILNAESKIHTPRMSPTIANSYLFFLVNINKESLPRHKRIFIFVLDLHIESLAEIREILKYGLLMRASSQWVRMSRYIARMCLSQPTTRKDRFTESLRFDNHLWRRSKFF